MFYDELAADDADAKFIIWSRQVKERIVSKLITKFTARYGITTEPSFYTNGAFNYCFKAQTQDGFDVIIRFPMLGRSAFRYEKINDECHILAYLSRQTAIPVPEVLASENTGLGPFIAMRFVEGDLLSERLRTPNSEGMAVLSPDIDVQVLRKAYASMAQILLDLSKCRFAQIGGVRRDRTKKSWGIGKRPWTMNMNELVSGANCPPNALSQQSTFSTANEYFIALAEDHITHLRFQRNDAVEDEDDCRKKYVARHLFRKIARNFSSAHNNGPFPLFCDDLRPSNVIVDPELNVRSVIDWEYCYAAPTEFTYCSPWWLLLARPDEVEEGLDWFWDQYRPRHELFLQVLRECEDDEEEEAIATNNDLSESSQQRLSDGMAQSLHNGHFWLCLAATSSFAFDDIYWKFVDPFHYGEFTSIDDRIALLSQQERQELEPFIRLKMEQAAERTLETHRTIEEILES